MIYRPLDASKHQIRVLKVSPGSGNDIVQGSLYTISIPLQGQISKGANSASALLCTNRGKYEAISYCWGDATRKTTMRLNGRYFQAPSGAVEALRALRFAESMRVVWIDGVCINQADHEERQQQVATMGSIYASACQNLVWLGPSEDDEKTKNALALCHAIASQFPGRQVPSMVTHRKELQAACDLVTLPDGCRPDLLEVLFDRPWYTRLWVQQEVALSPRSICHIGDHSIPWETLALVGFWVYRNLTVSNNDFYAKFENPSVMMRCMQFPATVSILSDSYYRANLVELVILSWYGEITDPRDKIFGLLGMTTWSRSGQPLPLGIQPNDQKSVRDCMRDATRVMIEEDQNLDVLGYARIDVRIDNELLPSWTPPWGNQDKLTSVIRFNYHAHNRRPLDMALFRQNEDVDVLTLEGFQISSVEATYNIFEEFPKDVNGPQGRFYLLCRSVCNQGPVVPETLLVHLIARMFEDQRVAMGGKVTASVFDLLLENIQTLEDEANVEPNHTDAQGTRSRKMTALLRNLFRIATGGAYSQQPMAT